MRTTFVLLLIAMPFWLAAQQTALFETTLWFTDAMGNTDSVVVGYDPDAKWDTLNPQFGEVLIDTPFDSVFEVRVSFDNNWLQKSNKLFSKIKIAQATIAPWVSPSCYDFVGLGIGIYIYAKHPPVTVTWKMEQFRHECRTKTLLTSHLTPYHIDNWHLLIDNVMDYTQCMAEDSTYTVTGPDDGWSWYNSYTTILSNDSTASLSVLDLSFRDRSGIHNIPCIGIVSVDQVRPSDIFRLFPNPASDWLRLELVYHDGSIQELQVTIYNTYLQQVHQHAWLTADAYLDIPLVDLPGGMYYVEVKDRIGGLVNVQRLIVE